MPTPIDDGNFVSEWFGHRTYPLVHDDDIATRTQQSACCPFLSEATGERRDCVKAQPSAGVCTINNASNGTRQDWLVCPHRALEDHLLEEAVRRLFDLRPSQSLLVRPATTLASEAARTELLEEVEDGTLVVVYLRNKLGGEISVESTPRSPALSFDITFVELLAADRGGVTVGRFGVLEVQTMDFHGSYRHAVKNLNDALRLHGSAFPTVLQQNQRWLAEKIEGPNIANVFKRTFYQMMLKLQLGLHPRSVGASLAIPQAVWDSWQPHLGRPELPPQSDGTFALQVRNPNAADAKAWIHVFDLDAEADVQPSPVVVRRSILTDTGSIAYYALEDVPQRAFAEDGAAGSVLDAIVRRLSALWDGVVP